jgi:hypothetical protein
MIVLALVLLLVVAAVVAGVLLSTPAVHELSVFRVLIPVTDVGMFLAGAAVTLLAVIAIIVLRSGIRRSRARRKDIKAIQSRRSRSSAASATTSVPAETLPGAARGGATTTGSEPATPAAGSVGDQPSTDSAERARLLAEADAATRDEPPR